MPLEIIHSDDDAWDEEPPEGKSFGARRKKLAHHAGNRELGCSLYELPPGRKAFPYHFHHANEEAMYVLAGEATLRRPDGDHVLRPGDYVAFPRGETGAHQVRNTGEGPFRFLCMSTMQWPDVTQYPDSGKVGIFSGSAPGGPPEARTLTTFVSLTPRMKYLQGEP